MSKNVVSNETVNTINNNKEKNNMNKKTWRLNRDQYTKMSKAIESKKETIDEWTEMSLSGKLSKDELMCRIMMDNDPFKKAGDHICILYVCESYKMDEEFLKDVIYVNSGMALIGCWDEKVVKWVTDLCAKKIPATNNACANIFEDVKNAIDSRYFSDIPEYEAYLKTYMAEYQELSNKLLNFKITSTNPKDIAKEIIAMEETAYKVNNYNIEIHDRLDWAAIEAYNVLTYKFTKKYSKKMIFANGRRPIDDNEYIEPSIPIGFTMRNKKYTAKKTARKKEEV